MSAPAWVAVGLLGGALALAAYALFPTWQTVRLPDRLAAYIEAGGRYAAAAVAAFGAPSADSYRAVREALLDHRTARAELLTATAQAAAAISGTARGRRKLTPRIPRL